MELPGERYFDYHKKRYHRRSELEREFPFIFRVHRFLLEYIAFLSGPLQARHCCTRDRTNVECAYVSLETHGVPSAHEQLEARLELRDWLQQNAYPDELEAIGLF